MLGVFSEAFRETLRGVARLVYHTELMDFRPVGLSKHLEEKAARVLDYQPFIVNDDLQTGAAYSWLYWHDPRETPPLVFHRAAWPESEWDRITTSNQGLRTLYDAFIRRLAELYPGGSLLDVGCNNGYFPVAAELAGMRRCAGMDQTAHNGEAIEFLNTVLGTKVEFYQRQYSPERRSSEALPGKFDVVCASAILCHIPDPLHFISYLAGLANEAVFFWAQIIDTEHFIISYNKPHPRLSTFTQFPFDFNDNTRLSIGLLKHSMSRLGFDRLIEIPKASDWISLPEGPGGSVEAELASGSRHMALIFARA